MYLGIDVGTSGVKAVLVDESQTVVDQAGAPVATSAPKPLWSEQDPQWWLDAVEAAMAELRARRAKALSGVAAVGLSGQMHSATLLDADGRVLRPAILWNDGRCGAECAELERVAGFRKVIGNPAMPGFTAPKLLWVRRYEPEVFRHVARVLLPKDYVRWHMTGDFVSDMADSAGTLWLDVARRRWSQAMLDACGLEEAQMPRLVEGSEVSAVLRNEVADAWGLPRGTPVAGGGGDNSCGAVGTGVVAPGRAFLSLGTSGVLFTATEAFRPNPDAAVHAFCHCLPGLWHQMTVVLSAAGCLVWLRQATGAASEAALIEEAGGPTGNGSLLFLPYLNGERTPHNDPNATGVFFGLTAATTRGDLARAVLEGVAFALADGLDALKASGTRIEVTSVIGGGARSRHWGRILASALGLPLTYHDGGEVGPAFGAARLARLAVTAETPGDVCTPLPVRAVVEPDPALAEGLARRREHFRALYRDLKPRFDAVVAAG